MLALDQRGSFRKMINPENPDEADTQKAVSIKKDILNALYPQFSGVLLDVDYGLKSHYELNPNQPKPFLLAIEKTGYTEKEEEKITELQYKVSELKEMGAAGVKLLVYFNLKAESAENQIRTAQLVSHEANKNGMPFFLEILTYEIPNQPIENHIIRTVKKFLKEDVIPDVFKLEYPGSKGDCREITRILDKIPWILLTRGVEFETFCLRLGKAVSGGCKGFLAGRSIWQEYAKATDPAEKEKLLKETIPARFEKISKIVSEV